MLFLHGDIDDIGDIAIFATFARSFFFALAGVAEMAETTPN